MQAIHGLWPALALFGFASVCGGSGSSAALSDARIELTEDRLVVARGPRPQLSPDGETVCHDCPSLAGSGSQLFHAVRVVQVDGAMSACLTCNRAETPRNAAAPAFHPDARSIAFSFEKAVHAPVSGTAADPGGGRFDDLAIHDLTNGDITPIYGVGDGFTLPPNGSFGALHPHVSHDGTKLAWADSIDGPEGVGEIFRRFRIGLGDYTSSPSPALTNVSYITIRGVKIVVVSGSSPDGTKLYAQCNSMPGQYDHEMDVCEIDIATGTFTRLV